MIILCSLVIYHRCHHYRLLPGLIRRDGLPQPIQCRSKPLTSQRTFFFVSEPLQVMSDGIGRGHSSYKPTGKSTCCWIQFVSFRLRSTALDHLIQRRVPYPVESRPRDRSMASRARLGDLRIRVWVCCEFVLAGDVFDNIVDGTSLEGRDNWNDNKARRAICEYACHLLDSEHIHGPHPLGRVTCAHVTPGVHPRTWQLTMDEPFFRGNGEAIIRSDDSPVMNRGLVSSLLGRSHKYTSRSCSFPRS